MNTPVAVPTALQLLIVRNNQILARTQQKLTRQVLAANEEMMRLLKLDPTDGWRLDVTSMQYICVPPSPTDTTADTTDDPTRVV
jgi:hypothetical protein